MSSHNPWPDFPEESAFNMQFQVYSKDDLSSEHEVEQRSEFCVCCRCKFPTFVGMTEEVSNYGEYSAADLHRNVPSTLDQLPSVRIQ